MGGLKFPNIELLVRAQKIAWIKRITCNNTASWMQLLHTFLPQMHIIDILKCSIEPDELAEEIPTFYRQVLCAWYEINPEPTSALDIRRQIVWFNKHIRINQDTIFKQQLYTKGLCTINDLLNENGKFLTYDNFNTKYNIHINSLEYMSLIHAIPIEWKNKIKSCTFPIHIIDNTEDPHIKINDQHKNITQVKSRDIYLKLLKLQELKPNCIEAWNSRLDLNLGVKDWAYIFTLPKETVSDTKVIAIQYKILHRCYATDSIISKWDNTKSEYCSLCNQKANIMHNFISCTPINEFWKQIEVKFKDLNILENDCIITPTDIILGKYKQVKYDTLNHAIMYAKYYIHTHYILNINVNATNFINYYKHILLIEKQRYTERNEPETFNKRFKQNRILNELHL